MLVGQTTLGPTKNDASYFGCRFEALLCLNDSTDTGDTDLCFFLVLLYSLFKNV